MRIGLVSNGLSRRNRRSLDAVRQIAEDHPHLIHVVLEGVTGLEAALADFARREVEIVAVNGGDGSVQAVLTLLLGPTSPFPAPPLVAILPGGTTNMTGADIGLRGGRRRGLEKLVRAAADGTVSASVQVRHVVGVDRGIGEPVQYGMFFGTAGICRAIDYCRRTVHPLHVDSGITSVLTVAGLLARSPFRRGGDTVFYGDRIGVSFDGGPETVGETFLLMVTTLERLILRSRPFWGGGSAPLRYTSVAWPPRRLSFLAPRVMYGGENRKLPAETYVSRRATRIALRMDCPYTLDGEIFQPAPGVPVTLSDGGAIGFVRF